MKTSSLKTWSLWTRREPDSNGEPDDVVYWVNAMVGVGALAVFAIVICIAAWRAPERDVAWRETPHISGSQDKLSTPRQPPFVLM